MNDALLNNVLCEAITSLRRVEFYYDGKYKIVEPHTLGTNMKANSVLSGYQVRGDSSRNFPDWGEYLIAKIDNLSIIAETFTPRLIEGYKRGHDNTIFLSIICEA